MVTTTWRSRLCVEKMEWRSETDTIPAISIVCLWKWNTPLHSSIPCPHCKLSKQFRWKTSNSWSDESDYRPHACVIPLIITAPWKEPKKGQTPTACEFRPPFFGRATIFRRISIKFALSQRWPLSPNLWCFTSQWGRGHEEVRGELIERVEIFWRGIKGGRGWREGWQIVSNPTQPPSLYTPSLCRLGKLQQEPRRWYLPTLKLPWARPAVLSLACNNRMGDEL